MSNPRLYTPYEALDTNLMFKERNITAEFIRHIMLMLPIILLFISNSSAAKMEANIQEAIYLFEMKGNFSSAISILEKVAKDGDEKDKEQAYFYLGKIYELSGNNQSANFYYRQSLATVEETKQAYWLAERDANTSSQPEQLLKKPLSLPSPIKKVFGENPAFVLLRNGSIKKLSTSGLQNVPQIVPAESEIYQISSQGIWYKPLSEDSLYFTSFHSSKQNRRYYATNITGFYEQDNHVLFQGIQGLTFIDSKGIGHTIKEKYQNCSIEGYFTPTRNYVLNCPDNSLHFISSESGDEEKTISLYDNITKTLIEKKFVYVISGNVLYSFIPKTSTHPIWKVSIGNVESIIPFENNIVLLEASGRLTLFDKATGFVKNSVLTETIIVSPLAKGTLGLFTSEGAVVSVDTLLRPLWVFNFTKPIDKTPIYTDEAIYLDFGDNKLQAIAPKFYGKKKLQSTILAQKAASLVEEEQWDSLSLVLDTLFKAEPGNAEGWFYKALYLENEKASEKQRQHAWSEAVRLSSSNPQTSSIILKQYGKAIGAKFIGQLPISPKTKYPQFFGNKKNLYTIDPAAEQLFCINPDNGELRWAKFIGKLDDNPVIGTDENIVAISTKYTLAAHELNKNTRPQILSLPGKAFDIQIIDDAIYISTWNGFLVKYSPSEKKTLWSRKAFSAPFLTVKNQNTLYLCSLEGILITADDASGIIQDGSPKKIANNITHVSYADSILFFANNANKILIYNLKQPENAPLQVLTDSPVASMQVVQDRDQKKILVSLANQSILLYTDAGAPLWKYQGRNSIFSKPFVKGDSIWIDQGAEIISISIQDGKIQRKFSTPGGAGTPFIINGTLFSASSKRILYGFSL